LGEEFVGLCAVKLWPRQGERDGKRVRHGRQRHQAGIRPRARYLFVESA
jgi:hypothetical protein